MMYRYPKIKFCHNFLSGQKIMCRNPPPPLSDLFQDWNLFSHWQLVTQRTSRIARWRCCSPHADRCTRCRVTRRRCFWRGTSGPWRTRGRRRGGWRRSATCWRSCRLARSGTRPRRRWRSGMAWRAWRRWRWRVREWREVMRRRRSTVARRRAPVVLRTSSKSKENTDGNST